MRRLEDFSTSYLKVVSACCWVFVFECSQWIDLRKQSRAFGDLESA